MSKDAGSFNGEVYNMRSSVGDAKNIQNHSKLSLASVIRRSLKQVNFIFFDMIFFGCFFAESPAQCRQHLRLGSFQELPSAKKCPQLETAGSRICLYQSSAHQYLQLRQNMVELVKRDETCKTSRTNHGNE